MLRTIPLAALVLVAATACGAHSGPASQAASPATKAPRSAASSNAGAVMITGNDMFRFDPKAATAVAGHVVVAFHGTGSYPHNIHFTSLKKTSASTTGGITGNDVTLDLGTLAAGTYAFVCDYHEGAGMRGVLTVR